jgi:xylan 1,4-beta-xylosidase
LIVALAGVAQEPVAHFDWFEYAGHDSVFEQPLHAENYRNPILAGFYPDPSVVRVADTYYLVNSTFTYFPGIPVFASHDLIHWRQIGSVIDRPSQLQFDGLGVSRGVFAPAIAFHKGVFYVITTAVDAGGNFLSVARDPGGPWSDPIWLPQLDGIDPSLFFDADDKVYVLNNGPPADPPQYEGHRAIWVQQLDLAARKLIGPRKVLIDGGVDFASKPVWIEGPHLYRHDGWYFLMCAEGGTSVQHSEVVFRSRSVWGPFVPFAGNPILTQRDLPADRPNPVANAGHADLVETPGGGWWAVFLGSRPYEGIHYNTGRETFLLPVKWMSGWPSILTHGQSIPYVATAPGIGPAPGLSPEQPALTGNFTWRDEFDSPRLKPEWLQVRVPKHAWIDLRSHPGSLTIHALPVPLDSLENPSFLARRQQHTVFDASTELEIPGTGAVSAGLAAFQSESYWYFLAVRRHDLAGSLAAGVSQPVLELSLERRSADRTQIVSRRVIPASGPHIRLRISGSGRAYSFYFDTDGAGWKALTENDDGSILSTDVAGGFVGSVVGPYARLEAPR